MSDNSVRNLGSTRMSLLDDDSQRAVAQYYACLVHDGGAIGDFSMDRAAIILGGKALSIPERFWTHRCASCRRTGAVIPAGSHGQSVPVDWKCQGCGGYVCFNCTLKVPGSVPQRFREETLCSEECWEKIGAPREEDEFGVGLPSIEWSGGEGR